MATPSKPAVERWGYRVARGGLLGMAVSFAGVAVVSWTAEPSIDSAIVLLWFKLGVTAGLAVLCVGAGMVHVGRRQARKA